jgi:hypothetical protein
MKKFKIEIEKAEKPKDHVCDYNKTSWDFLRGIPIHQYKLLRELRADPYICKCGLFVIRPRKSITEDNEIFIIAFFIIVFIILLMFFMYNMVYTNGLDAIK